MNLRRISFVLVLTLLGSAPARAVDLDPLLPADTENYLSVNLRQIIDSPLFQKQLLAPLKEMMLKSGGEQWQTTLREFGVDPFKDVDRITIATPTSKEADRGLVIVQGRFDPVKVETKGIANLRGNGVALKLHDTPLGGGIRAKIWEYPLPQQQDSAVFVSIVGPKTPGLQGTERPYSKILMSLGKDYVVDALKLNHNKLKSSLKSKEMTALIEQLDARQSISLAVMGKSLPKANQEVIPAFLTEVLGRVEALGGGVTVRDDVKLELLLATPDSDSASRMQKAADKLMKSAIVGLALLGEERQELSLLFEVVKSIKISNRGKVVTVAGRVTQDVIEDFFRKGE